MDEETRQAFDRLQAAINDGIERVLDQQTALRHDFQNTRGFLLTDAISYELHELTRLAENRRKADPSP